MINVNDTFRKEPDAGKPHVRNFLSFSKLFGGVFVSLFGDKFRF